MKRFLKILFRFFVFISIGLFIGVVSAVTVFWIWPEKWVNEKTVRWAMQRYIPPEIHLKWKDLKIDFQWVSLWRKKINIQASDFCAQMTDQKWQGCLSQFDFSVDLGFFSGVFHLLPELSNGHIATNGNIQITTAQSPGKIKFTLETHTDHANLTDLNSQYKVHAVYSQSGQVVDLTSVGLATLEQASGELSVKAKGWSQEIPQIDFSECGYFIGGYGRETMKKSLRLDCPLDIDLAMRSIDVQGDLQVYGSGDSFSTLAKFPPQWEMQSHLKLNVDVPRFQSLVSELSESETPVPAPLSVLDGKVHVELEGRMNHAALKNSKGMIDLSLNTKLLSLHQFFDVTGKGAVDFQLKKSGQISPHLDLTLFLDRVKLELPRLELAALPRLVSDPRFQAGKFKGNSKFNLNYKIHVQTPAGHPVILLSNLAKQPIPIDMNIELASAAPIKGFIQVQKFGVELFRRKAQIDHFILHFKDPMEQSTLDGLAMLDLADYKIGLRVGAILEKPQLVFFSDPPLPENEILATVLFGKSVGDLDSDQAASVGNTRAAIADGAMNLVSLYALASTPIQSVGYDPVTKSVTAKLKIAEGTSLNIGTSTQEVVNIGIRKRLGGFWSIQTDLARSSDTGQTATAYLEWSHRY